MAKDHITVLLPIGGSGHQSDTWFFGPAIVSLPQTGSRMVQPFLHSHPFTQCTEYYAFSCFSISRTAINNDLSPMADLDTYPIHRRAGTDHLVSPGLLQLTAVRHQRRTTSTPAVGAELCRPPGHRRPSV